jgi:hypothetical protein
MLPRAPKNFRRNSRPNELIHWRIIVSKHQKHKCASLGSVA